jgi:hypothetical protein
MHNAHRSGSIPPPLPSPDRPNYLGAAAFAVAVVDAGLVAGAIVMLREHAQAVEGFSPGDLSGGTAFSLNFYPLVAIATALASGAFATLLLLASCIKARSERRPTASAVHFGATLFLLPFFYLVLVFLRHSFR